MGENTLKLLTVYSDHIPSRGHQYNGQKWEVCEGGKTGRREQRNETVWDRSEENRGEKNNLVQNGKRNIKLQQYQWWFFYVPDPSEGIFSHMCLSHGNTVCTDELHVPVQLLLCCLAYCSAHTYWKFNITMWQCDICRLLMVYYLSVFYVAFKASESAECLFNFQKLWQTVMMTLSNLKTLQEYHYTTASKQLSGTFTNTDTIFVSSLSEGYCILALTDNKNNTQSVRCIERATITYDM